jgi:DNA-binding HxlR family transcriptional regulator
MKPYGQFCSIAKALEVIGERWTPLILRELICGSARFNEIQRGIPRISPSLLTTRLAGLEKAGVIRKREKAEGYELTQAGWELKPMVETLGVWGQRWVRGQLTVEDLNPDVLMWDMRRRINLDAMPVARTCICFEFTCAEDDASLYWLVKSDEGVELCITDPNFDVDLYVTTDVRTMIEVWNGDAAISTAIELGAIDLHGSQQLRAAFPSWLQLSLFAGIEPAQRE